MKVRNEPRNRVYPAGRHQQRLQRLLADQGFKIDVLDLVFMDANQFVFRSGPYWATRAIDPKGREVSLCGRFRMRAVCGPLLVLEKSPYEFEVFLPPTANEAS
jgi:hypothetical protein